MTPTAVLLDFDGTAALDDLGVRLLERFARDDSWKVIDNDYVNGRVGSRIAYRILEDLLTGGPADWEAFALAEGRLDPGLGALAATCEARGWRLEVLSDGLTTYIGPQLARAGLDLPVRASRLEQLGGRARIFTPHLNPRCGRCGTCKTERVEALVRAGWRTAYVGDGYSDLCAAPRAQRLFAKARLAEHCRTRGVPFEPFDTLYDVARALEDRGRPWTAT
ncbi:MAG: haloacid dehalogenase-like hydrolase [Deferrisomatales bacterium]